VQDGRERERLLAAERAELEVATMRVRLEAERVAEMSRRVAAGVTNRQSLAAAEADLAAMEANLARVRLNIEEIQASARSARDDMSAPRVRQRDFVAERLRLELGAAQARLTRTEALAAEAKRRRDVGMTDRLAQVEVEARLAEARAEMERLVRRAELREEVVREGLAPAEVARREQRIHMEQELKLAEQLRALAEQRVEGLRQRRAVGVADQVDVLRAQLEAAERAAQIERIRQNLEAADRAP
jgi:colicin import membrane protein